MKIATDKEKALKDMIALVGELLPAANLADLAHKKALVRVQKAKDALHEKGFKTLKAVRPGFELVPAVKAIRGALANSPVGKLDPAVGPNPFVPLADAVRIARQVRDDAEPFKFDRTGVSDEALFDLGKFFVIK